MSAVAIGASPSPVQTSSDILTPSNPRQGMLIRFFLACQFEADGDGILTSMHVSGPFMCTESAPYTCSDLCMSMLPSERCTEPDFEL